MEGNAYNLISFQGEEYCNNAQMEITPAPDSVIRVFMAWQGLDEPIEVEQQVLQSFERNGFTVVEWGGAMMSGEQKRGVIDNIYFLLRGDCCVMIYR